MSRAVRLRAWAGLALAAMTACEAPGTDAPEVSLGDPIPGLPDAERGRFLLGRALFERLATPDEGLGPLFNGERCSDCHDMPAVGGGGVGLPVVKATRFEDGACDPLLDVGGDNVQQRATALLAALGGGPEEVPAEATATARVIAPPLFGLGLVEAIPDSVLERLADPADRDGDGISGRLPRLADGRAARFGRKGDAADVAGFVDTALRFELGLTTPEHPVEESPNGGALPPGADPMPEPEIDARGVRLLTDYVRFLAPPERERPPDAAAATAAARGEELFRAAGCAGCHVPELTGDGVAGLGAGPVALFSDLLVHDLGRPTGDVCGPDVAPGEYRTPPLWGLRHRGVYLHDGAATDVAQAIALHGGEASTARDAFLGMEEDDRRTLLRFLDSL